MNNLELAHHPNTTPEILQVLATDKFSHVRYAAAHNPNTTPEILQVLATDKFSHVRYAAAHNPNATEIVRRLFLMTEDRFQTVH
jgi:hypothetical protein